MNSKILPITLLYFVFSCAGGSEDSVQEPLGANRQQATIQEGRDNISNPAVPATQVPPAGVPELIPPVQP